MFDFCPAAPRQLRGAPEGHILAVADGGRLVPHATGLLHGPRGQHERRRHAAGHHE